MESTSHTDPLQRELAAARLEAELILSAEQGKQFEALRPSIDTIASARRFVHEPNQENEQAFKNDLFWTAYEAQTSRDTVLHPPVRYVWNGNDFECDGRTMRDLTLHGVSVLGHTDTAIAEHMLGAIPRTLVRSGDHRGKVVRTISLPPELTEHSQIMVRDMWFEDGPRGTELVTQQMSIVAEAASGSLLEQLQHNSGMSSLDVDSERIKTAVLEREEAPSFIETLQAYDRLAGTVGGKHTRNQAPQEFYSAFESSVEELSERALAMSPQLGTLALELARAGVRHVDANEQMHDKVDEVLHEACRQNPELARVAFGDAVADLYVLARMARSVGDEHMATQFEEQARNEGESMYCDYGSCGIGMPTAQQSEVAHELGLNGDIYLLEDRDCPECRQAGGVLIDDTGEMACTKCESSTAKREQKQPATIGA